MYQIDRPSWAEFWDVWTQETGCDAVFHRDFEKRWKAAKATLMEVFGGLALVEEVNTLPTRDEIRDMADGWFHEAIKRFTANPTSQTSYMVARLERLFSAWFYELTPEELCVGRWLVCERGSFAGQDDLLVAALDPRPQKGAKLGKVLRSYLKAFADDLLYDHEIEWWVQQFSSLLGRLRPKKATVVVSLDPLDFLLTSESTTGWRSCHSLTGCHCAGNLAYLMDNVTAIAYAFVDTHGWRGMTLPRKIWRQWVFIDADHGFAYFQRQYPAKIEEFSKVARRLVGEALARYLGVSKEWTVRRDGVYNHISCAVNLPYLDPTSSAIRLKDVEAEPHVLYVGELVYCPACWEQVTNPGSMVCNYCDGKAECAGCALWYDANDMCAVGDDLYCEDCFDERFAYCTNCDAVVYRDEAYVGADGGLYCESCWDVRFTYCYACDEAIWREDAFEGADGEFYCESCWDSRFICCAGCGTVIWQTDAICIDWDAYCDECVATCESCGKVFYEGDLDSNGLCEDCAAAEEERRAV